MFISQTTAGCFQILCFVAPIFRLLARTEINMHNLFEPGDIMNSPYEAFIFDTSKVAFPVRQHWHYYMELLYIVSGTVLVTSTDIEYTLHTGDVILFYPQNMHSISYPAGVNEKAIYYVIKFDLNRFRDTTGSVPHLKAIVLQSETDPNTFIHFTSDMLSGTSMKFLFEQCIKEYYESDFGHYLAIRAYLTQIILMMIRMWRSNGFVPSITQKSSDTSIENITEYIDANSHKQLHVEDLAAHCNMSYSFFAKKFKQIYGRSCKEYIEYIRVTKAEDMLLFTDYDLTYISQETGFSDCSHMIKTFKKYKNITPKQFRLQKQGTP